ncbi:MAG: ATP-binding protein [bacterium]|nr:MAG: ATP-binding protein [bacterium]
MNSKEKVIDIEILVISSNQNELFKVENLSNRISKKVSLSEGKSDNLAIVLTELVNNAILHGNKSQPHKTVTITVTYFKSNVKVSVKDQGNGFNPSQLKDPRDPENLWKEGGRGIFLVKNLVDEVEFNPSKEGMEIIVTEYLDE